MISMREMTRRKKGIEAIRQMAKAMGLISTVRFQQTRERAERAERSFALMRRTMADLAKGAETTHPYLRGMDVPVRGAVFVTSDRGLAGGYTTALIRLLKEKGWNPGGSRIWAVGKKGAGLLERRGFEIFGAWTKGLPLPKMAECLSAELLKAYKAGEIGEIHLFFTRPGRGMELEPGSMRLLPPEEPEDVSKQMTPMNFEPSFEEALEYIIPAYLCQMIYGGLLMGQAAENRARMEAMDAAERNAKDMVDALTLQFHRARQGAITRELAEIVSGDL